MKFLSIIIRRFVYIVFGFLDRLLGTDVPDVIILCYHGIGSGKWQYEVDLEVFKQQIDYLLTIRNPITLDEFNQYLAKKKTVSKPSFVITFDDGYKSITLAKEYLDKKQIKPTVFVLSDQKNANRHELGTNSALLSFEEIKKLLKNGWEIGSHSSTHPNFAKLTSPQIHAQIQGSKLQLEKKIDTVVKYIAFPKGEYTKNIIAKVKSSNYQLGLTMDDGLITTQTNPLKIPRIGIDKSHSLSEFKSTFSPTVIKLRGQLKKYNLNQIYG